MTTYPRIRTTTDPSYSTSCEPLSLDNTRLPSIGKLEPIPKYTTFNKSVDLLSDTSRIFENLFQSSIGDQPSVRLNSALYIPLGIVQIQKNSEQLEECERIGDLDRRKDVEINWIQNGILGIGAAGGLVQNSVGIIQGFQGIANLPTNHILTVLNAGSGAFGNVLYGVYYATVIWCAGEQLYHLSKGTGLRDWLLSRDSPLREFKKKQEELLLSLKDPSLEELETIAIEEGCIWLNQVFKEAKREGLISEEISPSPEIVKEWLLQNSHRLTQEIDTYLPPSPSSLTSEIPIEMLQQQNLANFGYRIYQNREMAKWVHLQAKLIGTEAVEAALKGDESEFKTKLETTQWNHWGPKWKATLKLALGCLGISVMILMLVNPFGLPLWIPCLLFIVISILWAVIGDFKAFKDQWQKGEIGSRDKYLVFGSAVLNGISCAILLGLIVASGGSLAYILALVVPITWFIINLKSMHDLHKRHQRSWEYLEQPDLTSFEQLIQTNPSEDKIFETIRKMSKADRTDLCHAYRTKKNWFSAVSEISQNRFKIKIDRFAQVLEEIEASFASVEESHRRNSQPSLESY